MPLFFQQDIDADTRLAVWKIEEDEAFFHVPLQRDISHPKKRLQHMAGRYLLRFTFPEFPLELIEIADTRKPFLKEEAFHFSISHCGDHAAVLVSRTKRVGVDVEVMSDKIARIRHKFLSDNDHSSFREDLFSSTQAWSCKEAVFKWWGEGGVDFREHIHLKNRVNTGEDQWDISTEFLLGDRPRLALNSVRFNDLCLSWVVV